MERDNAIYHLGSDLGFTFGSLIFFSLLYFILGKWTNINNFIPYEAILFIVSLIFLYRVIKK